MIDTTMTPGDRAAGFRTRRALRRWALAACLCVAALVVAAGPSAALAQDEEVKVDARLEGYQTPVTVSNQSTALMWLLFVLLGVIALAVLFKDAKRTHLD